MITAALTDVAAIAAPTIALLIGILTIALTAERAGRQRRQDLHAGALAAAMNYGEMPFAIRRRRHEDTERSGERVRLTTRFSEIQAEISACQSLIDAESNEAVSTAYQELIETTRRIAGQAARDAWNGKPIDTDPAVNMPELAAELKELHPYRDRYTDAMRAAARSPWTRFKRAINPPAHA